MPDSQSDSRVAFIEQFDGGPLEGDTDWLNTLQKAIVAGFSNTLDVSQPQK